MRRNLCLGVSFCVAWSGLQNMVTKVTTPGVRTMSNQSHTSACPGFRACDLSRRSLLKVGGMGLLGLTMPALLRGQAQALNKWGTSGPIKSRAKSVIFLYQFGGPSHIDMFDMKPNA